MRLNYCERENTQSENSDVFLYLALLRLMKHLCSAIANLLIFSREELKMALSDYFHMHNFGVSSAYLFPRTLKLTYYAHFPASLLWPNLLPEYLKLVFFTSIIKVWEVCQQCNNTGDFSYNVKWNIGDKWCYQFLLLEDYSKHCLYWEHVMGLAI